MFRTSLMWIGAHCPIQVEQEFPILQITPSVCWLSPQWLSFPWWHLWPLTESVYNNHELQKDLQNLYGAISRVALETPIDAQVFFWTLVSYTASRASTQSPLDILIHSWPPNVTSCQTLHFHNSKCPPWSSPITLLLNEGGTTTLDPHMRHPCSTMSSNLQSKQGLTSVVWNLVGHPFTVNSRTLVRKGCLWVFS